MGPQVKPPAATRRYESPVRRARAAETEQRILTAAQALFEERGYVRTTLAAVAERADVNARTVYKIFGSKVRLLHRLVDVAVVGDQEAVPVAERSWVAAAYEAPSGPARVQAYGAVLRRIMASAGVAFRIAAQAAAADPEVAELWASAQRWRREDASSFVAGLQEAGMLRAGVHRDDTIATVWLVSSPETFVQITDGLDWPLDRYERWAVQVLADSLLDPDARGRPPS